MSKSKLTKLTPFVDNVGRVIVGRTAEKLSSTASTLQVKNPAIVNIQMQEDGQVSVQLIPYMFREFLVPENQDETTWEFQLDQITYSKSVSLDDRITEQYRQIFELTEEEKEELNKQIAAQQNAGTAAKETAGTAAAGDPSPEVVKLFDE